MFADTQFNYGARLLAQAMSRRAPRTWPNVFTRRRPRQAEVPNHGQEIAHVFGNAAVGRDSDAAAFNAQDESISAAMMTAWVTFAQQGDQILPGRAHRSSFAEPSDRHLEFTDAIRRGYSWRREQFDFLDNLCGDP